MTSRIDGKMLVPLEIVAVLFATGIGVTITSAFWVKGVNDRLESFDKRFSRVESKLGITEVDNRKPAGTMDFIPRAEARGMPSGLAFKEK